MHIKSQKVNENRNYHGTYERKKKALLSIKMNQNLDDKYPLQNISQIHFYELRFLLEVLPNCNYATRFQTRFGFTALGNRVLRTSLQIT